MVLMPCGNCCCKVSWPGWPYNAPDSIEVELAASSAKYGTLEWNLGTAKKATIYTPAVAAGTYSLAYDSGSGKYKYTEAHSFSIEFSFAYPGGQEEASRLCKSDNTITVKKGPRVVLEDIKSESDMAASSWYSSANAWHFLGGSGVNVSPQYWWHDIRQQDDSLTPLLNYSSTALTDTETQTIDGYVDVYLPSASTSFRYPVCVLPMRAIAQRVGFSLPGFGGVTSSSGLSTVLSAPTRLWLSTEDENKVDALRFVYSSGSFSGFSTAVPGCS
jgi:hypothetical protein